MGQLDETIEEGQYGHRGHHDRLHEKANYIFDVADFGADPDLGDVTSQIQAAFDAAAVVKGRVTFKPGVFKVTGLVLDSQVTIQGEGVNATVIQLIAGTTSDVIQTKGFDSLVGTGSLLGVSGCVFRDLTIDGNKAQNVGAGGRGIALYGTGIILQDVLIKNCTREGIESGWGSNDDGAGVGGYGLEDYLSNVRVVDCGKDADRAVYWNGPHDSIMNALFIITQHLDGLDAGLHVGPAGGACQISNSHIWGIGHDYVVKTEAALLFSNTQLEGGRLAQLYILANDVTFMGGHIFGAGGYDTLGLKLGSPTVSVAGVDVMTKISNCELGALDLTHDGGESRFICRVWQTRGDVLIGNPHPNTVIDMVTGGGPDPAGYQYLDKTEAIVVHRAQVRFSSFGSHAPAVAFRDDPSTGVYLRPHHDHQLGFATWGTGRWYIDESGHFLPEEDNMYDIGGYTEPKPRNIFADGYVHVGGEIKLGGDLNHDGNKVGFYHTHAIAKQTGVTVDIAAVHAALTNLGLIS